MISLETIKRFCLFKMEKRSVIFVGAVNWLSAKKTVFCSSCNEIEIEING